ncbi:MAG: M3 family metallopeptidase [Bdellovibrionaceae bacterium]|nr:M3 family metallopeptidase [Pseudobdellovibrionaceae bacterium]
MLELFKIQNSVPHGAIPFDQIAHDKFLELIEAGIAAAKQRIESLKARRDLPSFESVILPLELSGCELDRVSTTFFNLLHTISNETLEKQADQISALLSGYSNDVQLDEVLFKKVEQVHNAPSPDWTIEQKMLVKKYFEDFVRNGARLSSDKKEKLRAIDNEFSQHITRFGQNLLKATNAYLMTITDSSEVAGIPQMALDQAAHIAKEKDKSGWCFSLQAPSYMPFMTYANHRSRREELWRAFNSRAFHGEFDNSGLCLQIAKLRQERAELLGFTSHADFTLSRRMAKSPETVKTFLTQLLAPSQTAAKKEINELTAFAKKLDGVTTIMPWDFAYYSEKLKQERFQYSEEDLRPYFEVNAAINGVFLHAEKLFGLKFKRTETVPAYHPDVQVFEVLDQNHYIGLLYVDLFARDTKRGGAWMTSFLDQGSDGTKAHRPHVSIVCNFTKPSKETPSLLTFSDVQTLFHEFGHALHGLLSDCMYPSVSGTNVMWDFVELPSQIMENWATQADTLNTFAKHYKTGELLPESFIQKIKDSRNYNAGSGSLRHVSFALVDLAWHSGVLPTNATAASIEESILGSLSVLPRIEASNFSVAFSHIFAGGYSAGYYSYKWAEVLDADAFEAFIEKGIYNQDVAQSFRKNILSRGGSEEPDVLYRNFRGRDPDPKALLRRSGLLNV